jgi:antirestriction protein ArdC
MSLVEVARLSGHEYRAWRAFASVEGLPQMRLEMMVAQIGAALVCAQCGKADAVHWTDFVLPYGDGPIDRATGDGQTVAEMMAVFDRAVKE